MAFSTPPQTTDEPTTLEKMRGLPWSMAGNASNVVFVKFTFFGSTFVLFLSALGLNKSEIGFLLSLLPYFGITALFVAPFVARIGFKRAYLTFWSLRQIGTFGILFTPLVISQFGLSIGFIYVTIMVAIFALFRAMGETAGLPWRQEFIPDSIRGKYSATDSMFTTVASFVAVIISSQLIAYATGINGYLALFAAGGVAGLIGVWFFSHIPGGKPVARDEDEPSLLSDFKVALKDRNFLIYMLGVGLVVTSLAPFASFLPLFMEEIVGISTSNVILLQVGTLLGTLIFSYLWGWTSDRYGSKPVLMMSVFMRILLPILFALTPRSEPWNLWYALSISVVQGMVSIGWVISSGRMLFVGVVPPDKKAQYMALYYAWIGVIGGTAQLFGGRLVDLSADISGEIFGIPVSPYTPLFLLSAFLPAVALLFFRKVRADADYGVGEFAGFFVRGKPIMAMRSLVSYQFARNEAAMVAATARLGESQSPLTEDELLEALQDPRYHVRMEAIVSIARMQPDRRLIQAMVEVLNGTELALSSTAAWALGRMGDPAAIPYLRAALHSPYRSIQAQCVRALGVLDDQEMAPVFLERLRAEMNRDATTIFDGEDVAERSTDKGLEMAYAHALGRLVVKKSAPDLLKLLYGFENVSARMAIALALARLQGEEHYFIQLLRHMRNDPGTSTAQAVIAIRKQLEKSDELDESLISLIEQCSDALAHGDLNQGASQLGSVLAKLPLDRHFDEVGKVTMRECATRLTQYGDAHIEYLVLALHTLHVAWKP